MNRSVLIFALLVLTATMSGTELRIHKTDGTTVRFAIDEIESITFAQELEWVTASVEAVNTRQVIFYSSEVGDSVSFHIFLPDEYETEPARSFPVLYWLHGAGGGVQGIPLLANFFREAMLRNDIPAMIIVFPNGLSHGMWCDARSRTQPVESMFINDLLPIVDENFRTVGTRSGRIVEGWSMGGYGAARFGLKYYQLFGGFSLMGAGPLQLDLFAYAEENIELQRKIFREVYDNDMEFFETQSPWRFAEQYGHLLPDPTPKRQIIGNADHTYQANLEFHNHLTDLEIPHQYRELEGIGHNIIRVLNTLGNSNWAFYNAVFGD